MTRIIDYKVASIWYNSRLNRTRWLRAHHARIIRRSEIVMDKLKLQRKMYTLEQSGQEALPVSLTDFEVNGLSLSGLYNLNAWFGNTCFDYDGEFKQLEIGALLGKGEPSNQFGSGRFILFRCHCGCDYCGVISCSIERKGDTITWRDIGYENDSDDIEYPKRIEAYSFRIAEYEAEVSRYLKECV